MKKITFAGFATKYLGWDVSSFLKSTTERKPVPYIMVSEADPYRIPTYPRIILNDLSITVKPHPSGAIRSNLGIEGEDQNIFNSSDFITINTAFNSITSGSGKTLTIGEEFIFRDVKYLIVNINVTIADYFNDYSFTAFEKGIAHEGKGTPYNIVIQIDLKKIGE